MERTGNILIFVVCAILQTPGAFAQDTPTKIVQFELEQSSASLKPARWEGRPGIAVVFEGTEDIHYYARPETAPGPGLELTIAAMSDSLEFDKTILPEWKLFEDPNGQKIEVYAGDFSAFIPIRGESIPAGKKEVVARVQITGIACTSVLCLPPFDETLTTTLNLQEMAAWPAISIAVPQPPTALPPPAVGSPAKQSAVPRNTGIYYLLAIVAGLSINIMPCVLPVLPLILLRLVDPSRQAGRQRIASGMAFCAGIILFFAAFALVSAIVTLTTGAVLDLNSLFRYPAAVIVLFLAIVFFGLAMLDVVTLSLPSSVAGRQGSGSGLAGSVGMGFFAGVLSTPCSGALLGFVLVWAQTQPLLVSSTAITLMGVGMALPYAVIILIPSLLDRIPKPGYWMDIFKKSTGFLLFLIAVKLTLAALPKDRLLSVLMYGVVFSFCVWMWGKWVDFSAPTQRRVAIRLVAVMLAIGAGLWLLPSHQQPAGATLDWRPYDANVVQRAVSQRQPVLLKFTADWCTNCKVVERRVYEDPHVVQIVRAKGVLPIKADTTLINYPATKDFKTVYGEAGNVPVTVVLLPDGSREKLRGIFDKDELIRILSRLPGSGK
jgi:thiol:disulfide interchange protein